MLTVGALLSSLSGGGGDTGTLFPLPSFPPKKVGGSNLFFWYYLVNSRDERAIPFSRRALAVPPQAFPFFGSTTDLCSALFLSLSVFPSPKPSFFFPVFFSFPTPGGVFLMLD